MKKFYISTEFTSTHVYSYDYTYTRFIIEEKLANSQKEYYQIILNWRNISKAKKFDNCMKIMPPAMERR